MTSDQTSKQLSEDLRTCRELFQEKALETAELRTLVSQLRRRNARAEFLLDKVYDSWTWKIGRVVLFPATFIRLIRNKRAGL